MNKKEQRMGQLSFFDISDNYQSLSKCGDPLEKLNQNIKWEIFKGIIEKVFQKERKSNAGRPPFDYIMMFKVLILQSLYNLSDFQMEFQIRDRFTFRRFLGLDIGAAVPDEKTIWLFRETLIQKGIIEKLFKRFNRYLDRIGFQAQKGMMVDARIVEVPKQRNSREENQQIKQGTPPEDWEKNPAKRRQKDTDARWTKKHYDDFYGYKNHIDADVKHKIIREYEVTSANVHDSQVVEDILDPKNTLQALWADSAYDSEELDNMLKKRKIKSHVNKKGCRYKKLSEFQNFLNHKKSSIRVRVEHIFGFMVNTMKARIMRCIGFKRSAGNIGITNLVYNICRLNQLQKRI